MRLVKTPRRRGVPGSVAYNVNDACRSRKWKRTIASQPWKKQDVFVETAKWSPGKKARKKNFPESSRPQFRNNSRYDVTPALKWKPSARSSRRRRCYYSAKVKIMPGCLRRCPLPRGRSALQSFLQAVRKNAHVREVFCKTLRSEG